MLQAVIEKVNADDQFWNVLVNESVAQSGPFDGGCLICAKALQLAVEGAELIRISSDANGGQTEHYGIILNGSIYDMAGIADTEEEWITRFRNSEGIRDRVLSFSTGYDSESLIPDDAKASKKISQIFLRYIVR